MKTNITERRLILGPKKKAGDEVWDLTVPGFGYRKTKPKRAGYFIFYRHQGKAVRLGIGKYPLMLPEEARERARVLLAAANDGRDPKHLLDEMRNANQPTDLTVESLVERYIEDIRSQKSTPGKNLIFKRHIYPKFGHRQLADVEAQEWQRHFRLISEKTPVMGNRTHAAVSSLYSWCIHQLDLPFTSNPLQGVKRPAVEKSREVYLNPQELARVAIASRNEAAPFGPVIEVLARLCLRRSEVTHLRWSQVDLDKRIIKLTAGGTKNKIAVNVPLPNQVVAILKAQPRINEYVFPSGRKGNPLEGMMRSKRRLDAASGTTDRVCPESGVVGWQIHDLRRTGATHMGEEMGVDELVCDRILNHLPGGSLSTVAKVYIKVNKFPERKAALQAYSDWIDARVAAEAGANVVELVS